MKIIDGKNAVMGRLASYAAKEALKGEDIAIVNCEQAIITGNRESIRERFEKSRKRVGSNQRGPKVSKDPQMIFKRTIRGMLPNYRFGRGKVAYGKIKCYSGIPKEFEGQKKIVGGKEIKSKFVTVKNIQR